MAGRGQENAGWAQCDELLSQMLEGVLAVPVENSSLLCESVQTPGNLGKIYDESTVVVGKAQKLLNFLLAGRYWPSCNLLSLLRIGTGSIR